MLEPVEIPAPPRFEDGFCGGHVGEGARARILSQGLPFLYTYLRNVELESRTRLEVSLDGIRIRFLSCLWWKLFGEGTRGVGVRLGIGRRRVREWKMDLGTGGIGRERKGSTRMGRRMRVRGGGTLWMIFSRFARVMRREEGSFVCGIGGGCEVGKFHARESEMFLQWRDAEMGQGR